MEADPGQIKFEGLMRKIVWARSMYSFVSEQRMQVEKLMPRNEMH